MLQSWCQKLVFPIAGLFLICGCARTPVVLETIDGPYALFINVEGVQCCDGAIRVAVYNTKEHWLSSYGRVSGQIRKVLGASQRMALYGLPAGSYALAVHQDLNHDGKLNRFLGVFPREPYGFSGGESKGWVSFEDALIRVSGDTEITVRLRPPLF